MTTTESSLAKGLEGQFGNIGEGKLSRFGPVKSKNIGHDEVVGGVPALIGEHMKIEGLLADDGQDLRLAPAVRSRVRLMPVIP